MGNPITRGWGALRSVLDPISIVMLCALATILAGIFLWLPLPFAMIADGCVVLVITFVIVGIEATA